jgi:hypothetical protein
MKSVSFILYKNSIETPAASCRESQSGTLFYIRSLTLQQAAEYTIHLWRAMNIRNIAELIILQCIEDLWNEDSRVRLFRVKGSLCVPGYMDLNDQGRLLNMVGTLMEKNRWTMNRSGRNLHVLQSGDRVESFVSGQNV